MTFGQAIPEFTCKMDRGSQGRTITGERLYRAIIKSEKRVCGNVLWHPARASQREAGGGFYGMECMLLLLSPLLCNYTSTSSSGQLPCVSLDH